MSTDPLNIIHGGMGSIPHESGVAFRVWAPHADAMFVTGEFNQWSSDANPMSPYNAARKFIGASAVASNSTFP